MRACARLGSLAGVTLAVVTVLPGAQQHPGHGPAATGPAPVVSEPPVTDGFRSARTYPAVATPVRLRIKALDIDTTVQRLGLRKDGAVEVPADPDVAGWFAGGPRPGQAGPAVILGHVDSRTGPGVFIALSTVRRGTLIRVDRSDGSTVRFRVREVRQISKTSFPTDLVYAPTLDPTLRLVTCGGRFDHTRGSYRDNVIVFADQV